MIAPFVHLFLIAAVSAQGWLPLQTAISDENPTLTGWTPKPTAKPEIARCLLPLRPDSSSVMNRLGTCAYDGGDGYMAFILTYLYSRYPSWCLVASLVPCQNTNSYCAFNRLIRGAACCPRTTHPGASCSYFASCVASTDLSSCDSSCMADPYITKWYTVSESPREVY
jgi:hypothetical protein